MVLLRFFLFAAVLIYFIIIINLTYCGRMVHLCVTNFAIIWTLRNNLQSDCIRNLNTFIQGLHSKCRLQNPCRFVSIAMC